MARKLLAQVTCPHCWHESRAEELLWVATHPDLRGDPKLTADDGLRFLPTRFSPAGEAIDPLGSLCTEFACPACHLVIPPVALERPLVIYSIVGAPASGKSCYLASALREWRRVCAETFSLAAIDADPVASTSLARNEETLFLARDPDQPVALAKTELAEGPYRSIQREPGVTTLLPRPFLFTVRPQGQHPNAAAADACAHLMCLYDNAGEHFRPGADTAAQPGTQHLARASVLLFLFDPTQDLRFRPILTAISRDPQLTSTARTERQEVLISEMADRVRLHAGLGSTERLRKVLLVLVAKSDVWSKLVAEDFEEDPFWTRADQGRVLGYVDVKRVDRVSNAVREMMMRFVPEFVATAEDACDRVLYIPVSALGTSPTRDDASGLLKVRPRDVRPRWVTVPFAYSIARWGTTLIASNKSHEKDGSGSPESASPAAGGGAPRGATGAAPGPRSSNAEVP